MIRLLFMRSAIYYTVILDIWSCTLCRRRIEVNKHFSRGKKLRHVPFFLRSQRNDEIGWTSWTSNRLLSSQLRKVLSSSGSMATGSSRVFIQTTSFEKGVFCTTALSLVSPAPVSATQPHRSPQLHLLGRACLGRVCLSVSSPPPFPLLSKGAGNGPPTVLDLRSGNS